MLEFDLCPIYIEGVFDCLLSHWLLSLYDQHGISLAQVKGPGVGDGDPGDGVNLHQQPQHLAQTFWEHCDLDSGGFCQIWIFATKKEDQMEAWMMA